MFTPPAREPHLGAPGLPTQVHWYYNRADIKAAFPGGVRGFEAAPKHHPSSISACVQAVRRRASSLWGAAR